MSTPSIVAPADNEKVTLQVGTFSSSCSKCGLNAFPDQVTHDSAPSWSDSARRGCGARFTHIVATYTGISDERLQQMRPDLQLLVGASDSPPGAVGLGLVPPTVPNPTPDGAA